MFNTKIQFVKHGNDDKGVGSEDNCNRNDDDEVVVFAKHYLSKNILQHCHHQPSS